MKRAIQFVRWWRGREPGTINRELDLGVMEIVVQRGFAVWVEEQPPAPAVTAQPFKGAIKKR